MKPLVAVSVPVLTDAPTVYVEGCPGRCRVCIVERKACDLWSCRSLVSNRRATIPVCVCKDAVHVGRSIRMPEVILNAAPAVPIRTDALMFGDVVDEEGRGGGTDGASREYADLRYRTGCRRIPRYIQSDGAWIEQPPCSVHRHWRHNRNGSLPRVGQVHRPDRPFDHPGLYRRGPGHVSAHAGHWRTHVSQPQPTHLHRLHHPLPGQGLGVLRRLVLLDRADSDRHVGTDGRGYVLCDLLRHLRYQP